MLRLSPPPTRTIRALLVARHRDTGALVRRFVRCTVPEDLLLKGALAAGERWITVHPHHDPDEKGVPVLIRESKTEPGTWHVIAGAGGSLNYLRLTGVKTPREYREQAKAKQEAKKARAKHQRELETDRKANLTEEERKIEAERERQRDLAAQKAALELRTRQQEFVKHVAGEMGWADEEWQFGPHAERLKKAGALPERIAKLEEAHHKRVYRKALDVVQRSRRQLLADQDRARAVLGDVPIATDDPTAVALTDLLEKPPTPRGRGFQSITKASSDDEIRTALLAEDKERLRAELEEARSELAANEHGDIDGMVSPELAARVAELKGDLHTAELLELASTMTPEQIAARRAEIAETATRIRTAQAEYTERLGELREAARAEGGPKLSPGEYTELRTLEDRAALDHNRVERLRQEAVDLAVVAGETVKPAVAGEQKTISARRQADREAEIAAEHGPAAVMTYREGLEKLRQGGEKYRAEIRHYKETGALRKPELEAKPVVDAEKALDLLARTKALQKLERDVQRGKDDPEALDAKMYGKGYFTDVGAPTEAMREAALRDVRNGVLAQKARAFLERVESPELLLGRGGVFTEDYDRQDLHRALERHLSAGAYNALNNAALAATKSPILKREVVDTLGAAGAAQLLAHVLAERESPRTLREMAKSLGEYHVQANVEQSEERLREAEEALDRADEAMAAVTSPGDLAIAVAANAQRQAALEDARQTLGQALGEYEATAALTAALAEGKRKDIHVNLGPIGTETAVRQLRALGLGRADYEVTSDGANYFATIQPSGFAKLAAAPDPAHAQLVDDVLAIKKGAHDDPDWRPKGTIVRSAASLKAPGLEPPPLTHSLKPFGNFGAAGDVAGDVHEHVALRSANGDDPNDILADLHASVLQVPEAHRQAFAAAVSKVFPLTTPLVEHGKPVYARAADGSVLNDDAGNPVPKMVPTKAETHAATVRQLARDYFRAHGMDRSLDINTQALDTQDPTTHEAFTQALAKDPRAMVAFKAVGELGDQDQRTLRHYFATDVAPQDAATGYDKGAVDRALAELGPEPTKATKGLFGGEETTPEWLEWNQRRQAITADAHGTADAPKTTAWTEYVTAMGGTGKAYEALQDRLKSGFLQAFHRAYTTGHNIPLRVGTVPIAHAELHEGYLDPAARAQHLAERRQLLDEARTRAAGKYAEGSALEKMERIAQTREIERQNQMGLLGATPTATTREPKPTERYTLGQYTEGQIAGVMRDMARNWKPGEPVKLLANKQWADGPGEPPRFIHQQRTVKTFLRGKRLAAALGTGSGKTSIGIASLAHARQTPELGVHRGLFVVPSSVQGQFGGEFARFIEPGTMNWAANPGGDRAQRIAEHRQADTHAVVHTHQAFRDDMLHLVSEHWGVTPEQARDKFLGLSRKDAAQTMRDVWTKHGIDYQMLMVDEGHGLLDRQGKPDSLLSRIAQAVSDNTPYYMSASADPIKNDHTELRSLLDKLDPSGRYADAGEWNRRYGVNTTASAEALKREVAPYVYAAQIRSGNQVNRRRETVPLHPEQAKQYASVLEAFQKLQAARERGDVDIDAAKQLVPKRFANAPESEHAAIAKAIQRNPGTLKEQALARIIDMAPREQNAKIQHLVKLLADHPVKEKPVVVFAHNLKAVDEITEALAEAGHRVQKLTGADSTKERDKKRLAFQPESGDPSADVFVLSDAGEAGLNLQRGQTLVQYDRPLTAKTHAQRNGRIDRLGQQHPEIDLIDLTTDSPYEARAQKRIETKYALRDILTDPAEMIDDTGLAAAFRDARKRAAQPEAQRAA